jgi:hypothetical protein
MAFRRSPAQPLRLAHELGINLCPVLPPFTFADSLALTLTSSTQLGNGSGFFVLRKRACNLPHHHAGWIAAIGEIVAGRGQHAHTAPNERQNPKFLPHELAGEAEGVDDDGADAVALDPVEQLGKAPTCLDWIGAAHGCIGELADQGKPCPLGIAIDGCPLSLSLSLSAPTLAANEVRIITNCFNPFPFTGHTSPAQGPRSA